LCQYSTKIGHANICSKEDVTDGRTEHPADEPDRRPDNQRAMTVEGFASLRELIRRAVRQLDGAPDDVLEAAENHMRAHHDLLLSAWDELRHRGAAVTHLTTSERDRSCQLVDEVLQASGQDVPAVWRDPQPVAMAFIDLIAQEVKAYQRKRSDVAAS
jgi:hypothetical protein